MQSRSEGTFSALARSSLCRLSEIFAREKSWEFPYVKDSRHIASKFLNVEYSVMQRYLSSRNFSSNDRVRESVLSCEHRQLLAVDMLQISSQPLGRTAVARSISIGGQYRTILCRCTIAKRLTDDGWFRIDVSAQVPLTQTTLQASTESRRCDSATPNFVLRSQAVPKMRRLDRFGAVQFGPAGRYQRTLTSCNPCMGLWYHIERGVTAVIDTGVDYLHRESRSKHWVEQRRVPGNGPGR